MNPRPLFDFTAGAHGVRAEMGRLGLSYRQAADQAGLSFSTFYGIAVGRGRPDVENYLRIERWLWSARRRRS